MNRRLHFFRASRRLHPDSPADAIFLTMACYARHSASVRLFPNLLAVARSHTLRRAAGHVSSVRTRQRSDSGYVLRSGVVCAGHGSWTGRWSVANQLANRWEGEQWSEHQLGEQDSSLELVTDESSTASQRRLLS